MALNANQPSTSRKMKPLPKLILIGVAAFVIVLGLRHAAMQGWIPTPGVLKSVKTTKVDLPTQADATADPNVQPIAFPSSVRASSGPVITFDIWEWNAYSGLILANGGKYTTKGSLMEKYGVNNLYLHREDGNDQMKADLLTCANQLAGGQKFCTSGANAIVVMGDGGGQWLADVNPEMQKLGPQYKLVIIGAVGRSNGEDALLGPAEWKSDPQTMKGKTIVGVLRDGDWNIALNYMGSNNLCNNPDVDTYDPECVNWWAAPDNDYIKAVTEVYNQAKCDKRPVVKNGVKTGKMAEVCADGVVTWTPGDELAVHGRSGTFKIVSSREYSSQMPSVVIAIKKFADDNREAFHGILAATWTASDQIKNFDDARKKAAALSAEVYGDKDWKYWYNYFKGEKDARTGQFLGGSAVFNLQDNLNFFGIDTKHNNNMRATYETFAKIVADNYPNLYGAKHPIPSYKEAVDTSFIFGAQAKLSNEGVQSGEAEAVDYAAAKRGGEVYGKAAVYINFATGSDQPLPDGLRTLRALKDKLAVNRSLAIKIDGFTDNVGSDAVNVPLSERRAAAVKRYFQEQAPMDFPEERFAGVEGHGSQSPLAPNTSASNQALNRRVEITQIGQ